MDKTFSLYLDTVRFLAAVLVVISHMLTNNVLKHDQPGLIFDLAREAVICFFVLSGFVIAYVSDTREQTLKSYFIARTTRIYSVALPVLLLSFLIAFYYSSEIINEKNYQLSKAYLYIPFHLLFLGELWDYSQQPPWLVPYWSLSYEVWYYIFFATIYFFSGLKRILLASIVLVLIGHKLWLLMPIWWSGVFLLQNNRIF